MMPSCLRLAFVRLIDIRDAWQLGKTTLSLRDNTIDCADVDPEIPLYGQNVPQNILDLSGVKTGDMDGR